MPALRDVQRAFYDAVTRGAPPDGLAGHVGVYAEMYLARLHDVLAEQHARLVAALGAPGFRSLVVGYLADNPPQSFTIGDAGARLPAFLAARGQPALADLARLERLHLAMFEAADSEPAALAGLPDLEDRRVRLAPSAALMTSSWAVDDLWDDPTLAAAPRETRLCVWREDWMTICHRRIDDATEWAALARCAEGATIGEVGALLAADRSVEDAAAALFDLLRRIACVEREPSSPPPSPASSPPAATPASPRRSRRPRPRR